MPPDSRQVDVQQKRGEPNPAPTRGGTPQELATAAGAGDVNSLSPNSFRTKKSCGESLTLFHNNRGFESRREGHLRKSRGT